MKTDPKLDLIIQLTLDVSVEKVWQTWTTPTTFKEWFCPKPWFVSEARMDPAPGGEFYTKMNGPNGEEFASSGCIIEAIPNKKLVWTSAMGPGFRPKDDPMPFTAMVILEAQGDKTLYTAIGRHRSEADVQQHKEMGFEQGWTIVAEQLAKFAKSL